MSREFVLQKLVPGLGAIVSLLMYAAPVKAVMKAERSKSLGDLNPVPLAITIANCIAWLTYGLLKHDPFITTPNAAGVMISVFCTLTAHALADEKSRNIMRTIVCGHACVLPLLGVVSAFYLKSADQVASLWGLTGNAVCLVYYAAPLSTMAEVIRTRNSSSILLPLTIMNTLNAGLWTTYGLAVADPLVWLPNGIGLGLSLAQLALASMFPAKAKALGADGLPVTSAHASGGPAKAGAGGLVQRR